jgi:plastocyanin
MSPISKSAVLAVLVSLVVSVAALASSSATAVAVTAGKPSEFRFTLSKRAVPKGSVTFRVVNRGTVIHNFKIAGKKTKLIAKGKSATLTVALPKAGKYTFLCTVPGHAAGGMKGVLTVR